jgi:hypothetical protein
MKTMLAILAAGLVAGCAVQRAIVANETREKMVGLSREQVLACMGPPANKAAAGSTEVWSYNSGNGYQATFATASANSTGQAYRAGSTVYGTANSFGSGSSVSTRRWCTVNVTMIEGRVSRVNYVGPTGGLITEGEQCAFAVQACAN